MHKIVYIAVKSVIVWSIDFTSVNIHRELLSLTFFVDCVIVATAPELCQKCDFSPKKEDESKLGYEKT